ncbi:hypothetical protein PO909_027697 [Leuciscus waleckii]
MLKFADDTVIVSLLVNEETSHGPVVEDFVSWCAKCNLSLNISKTKDMIIDFGKSAISVSPTVINGRDIEFVDEYRYLGTVIDNKLNFNANTDAICKKVQQRMFFLRKMNSFKVCSVLMTLFYQSFIESVISYCDIVWFHCISLSNRKRLWWIVRTSVRITGTCLPTLQELYSSRVSKRAGRIILDPSHPDLFLIELLPSGRRY